MEVFRSSKFRRYSYSSPRLPPGLTTATAPALALVLILVHILALGLTLVLVTVLVLVLVHALVLVGSLALAIALALTLIPDFPVFLNHDFLESPIVSEPSIREFGNSVRTG